MDIRIILVTCPSTEEGRRIAQTLVEERLAACVNIIPSVTSVYRWQGAVQCDAEVQLVIKSSANKLQALEKRILSLHPYDTPEVIALEPEQVSEKYARWVIDSLR